MSDNNWSEPMMRLKQGVKLAADMATEGMLVTASAQLQSVIRCAQEAQGCLIAEQKRRAALEVGDAPA